MIPAIDLSEGKCVRLTKGNIKEKKVYCDDPVKLVKRFSSQGLDMIHIVDLDSAIEIGGNKKVVEKIVKEKVIDIQLGGGIRSLRDIDRWLSMGIKRVVIGTMAVMYPHLLEDAIKTFGSDRIVVAVDVLGDFVALRGWKEVSDIKAIEFAGKMEEIGVKRFLFTDIKKDGTLIGISLDSIKSFASSLRSAKVIASGGVSGYDDLVRLKKLEGKNVDSVIVGKALYEGSIEIDKAIAILED